MKWAITTGRLVFETSLNETMPRQKEPKAPKGGTDRRRFENGYAWIGQGQKHCKKEKSWTHSFSFSSAVAFDFWANIREKPRMAFKGERNSWDMLARNVLLARLAISAASFALCNSFVLSATWFSSFRLLASIALTRQRNPPTSSPAPAIAIMILNHSVSHQGGVIMILIEAPSSFQIPSLLDAIARKKVLNLTMKLINLLKSNLKLFWGYRIVDFIQTPIMESAILD